uniref:Putative transferase caf17 n=1 Tax=Schistocephalus solidus TaxID=70667 RepID=A0A0X3PA35_SCHSO
MILSSRFKVQYSYIFFLSAFQIFHPSDQSSMDTEASADLYTSARYRLGLPEGSRELKSGDGLPLEANADLLGAVSFSKGCYVGQELTTRTHFTGVIRRRMMPVVVASPVDASCAVPDAPIYRLVATTGKRQGKRPIGWLRGVARRTAVGSHDQQLGIALLRLADTADAVKSGDLLWSRLSTIDSLPDEATEVKHLEDGVILRPFVPSWWPKDIAPDLPSNLQ